MKKSHPIEKAEDPVKKRVLIVDDHPFLRLGLAEALAREPGLSVCGAVASAEEALTAVERLMPDVVVTDLAMPGKSGLELIKDLASLCPRLPVIVLSMHEEEIYAERCLRAGARSYVMKCEGADRLVAAIWRVLKGGIDFSARASEQIIEGLSGRRSRHSDALLQQLTDREFELLQWFGRGCNTQEIAQKLHLSAKTIETHRLNIKAKLGFATSSELIAYAARWMAAESQGPVK